MRRDLRLFALVMAIAVAACASRSTSTTRTPIAYRPITIDAHCVEREEDGFREDARLAVDANRVRALDWTLWVGDRGSCRFALDEFRQTRETPHVELVARNGDGCRLLVWQEPRHVTLAHVDCRAHCTGDVYDEAWPALLDATTGACAAVRGE